MKKKTGVLVHGFHLGSQNWQEIMWGSPPYLLGRLSKAALVALEEEAEIIVFGTGASEMNGKIEAQFILDYLLDTDNFIRLSEFVDFWTISLSKAYEKIKKIAVVESCSQNTAEAIRFSGEIFAENGVERIINVTSPTHAPRCLNESLKFYGRPESKICPHDISIQVSDTGWAPNDDVVVLEPPSRPDDKTGESRMKIARLLLQPEIVVKIAKTLGF